MRGSNDHEIRIRQCRIIGDIRKEHQSADGACAIGVVVEIAVGLIVDHNFRTALPGN